MRTEEVQSLKASAARDYLEKLMAALDKLDGEDFFGTEGWRRYLMDED